MKLNYRNVAARVSLLDAQRLHSLAKSISFSHKTVPLFGRAQLIRNNVGSDKTFAAVYKVPTVLMFYILPDSLYKQNVNEGYSGIHGRRFLRFVRNV